MTRMQVTIGEAEHRRAKQRAAALGMSLAEYIRRLVAADVAGLASSRPAVTAIFDLGESDGSDVARHKHQYLGEALVAEHRRNTGAG